MALHLHNTLSGKKELFTPIDPNRVTMYLCGPTVYNYAHIGNARPAVVFDVLNRLLRHHYDHVVFARNITDIDDKINQFAHKNNVSIKDVSSKYAQAYNEDLKALGVMMPDIEPYATDHVPEMIAMIEDLITKGHAYAAEGHVLFDVTTYEHYGELSNRSLDDMLAGARVEVAGYKRNSGDFVLWKPSDETQPGWKSPWSYGRPGWHIECSAMAAKHLAETIDIHCGGKDLIFPHHENEVAQSCCANGTRNFANYWVHNGFITMSDQKMSKSLGNIQLIREVLAETGGEIARWVLLSAHYRQPVDWTADTVAQAERTIDRIYCTLRDAQDIIVDDSVGIDTEILAALNDDINTPKVFARVNQLAKLLANAESIEDKSKLKSALLSSCGILGVLQNDPEAWFAQKQTGGEDIKERVEQLIIERAQARTDKDWGRSDEIRDELDALGVILEDSPEGTRWSMK